MLGSSVWGDEVGYLLEPTLHRLSLGRDAVAPSGTENAGRRAVRGLVRDLMGMHALERDGSVTWLDLASGPARQLLDSASWVRSLAGRAPTLCLVDRDASVLRAAAECAEHLELPAEAVTTVRRDLLSPAILEGPYRAGAERFDVVKSLWILEHLEAQLPPTPLDPDRAARMVLQRIYGLVKPGGVMITSHAVDADAWAFDVAVERPGRARSPHEMARLLEQSGLRGQLDVYSIAEAGRAVYRIEKPLD